MSRLFALSLLVLQASASAFPTRGHNPAGGGPTLISNIDIEAVSTSSTSFDKSNLSSHFGADGVIDCPGNTFTNLDNAIAAKNSFLELLESQSLLLKPGLCRHVEVDDTLAQICNRANITVPVDVSAATVAFKLLTTACSRNKASGSLETSSGLAYIIYARAVEATPVKKRWEPTPARDLQKRCTYQTQLPVTGCQQDVCDPKITLNGSGDCPNVGNSDEADGCSYLCEQQASRYYGVAATFDGTSFCSVSIPDSYLYPYEFNSSYNLLARWM